MPLHLSAGLGISVGQNLAWGYADWETSIQGWYDEVKDFNYGRSKSGVTGHFTAVRARLYWRTDYTEEGKLIISLRIVIYNF